MDIASTVATTTNAAATTATDVGEAASVLTSDFETFLELLTVQAKYQDPLEPIDSSEYAAQLAQFSMVEQQVQSNELLGALGSQIGVSNLASLSGWIGMEARTIAPAQFDGSPIALTPNPPAGTDQMDLIVYNSDGTVAQRQELTVSSDPIEWAGVRDDGTPFAEGNYTFSLEARSNGELLGEFPLETYSQIVEARSDLGGTVLVLDSGELVVSSAVTAIRDPDAL